MRERTWKEIENSRDARLWVTQVLIPIAGGVVYWMSDADRREATVKAFNTAKERLHETFDRITNRS